tara:strand:- start:97 stop:1188 length:1092 start_codon:yes stop_codon:yes gene_type:complete
VKITRRQLRGIIKEAVGSHGRYYSEITRNKLKRIQVGIPGVHTSSKFKESSLHNTLLEYKLQDGVTLYHRAFESDLLPGTLISSQNNAKNSGRHKSRPGEVALERYRRENFPDLPSRLAGAFATLQPQSRFSSFGHLYEVTPVGNSIAVDSLIVDKIWEKAGEINMEQREMGSDDPYEEDIFYEIAWLAKRYWSGVKVTRENIRNVEVLANEFKVIRRVQQEHRLAHGVNFIAPTGLIAEPFYGSSERIKDYVEALESQGHRIETKLGPYGRREKASVTLAAGSPLTICSITFLGEKTGRYADDPKAYSPAFDKPYESIVIWPTQLDPVVGCKKTGGLLLNADSIRKIDKLFKAGALEIISRT